MGNKQIKRKVKILQQDLNRVDADGDIPKIHISELSYKGGEYLLELVPAARGKRVKEVYIFKSVISSSLLLVLTELVVMKRVTLDLYSSLDANCRRILGWLSDLPSDREICLRTNSPNEELLLENLLEVTCNLSFRPYYSESLGLSRMKLLKLGKTIMVGNLCKLELVGKFFKNKRQERILFKLWEKATPFLRTVKLEDINVARTWIKGENINTKHFCLQLKEVSKRDVDILFGLKLSSTIQSVETGSRLSKTEKKVHLLSILLERSSVQSFQVRRTF